MKIVLATLFALTAGCGAASAQSTLPMDQQPGAGCQDTLNSGNESVLPCPSVPTPRVGTPDVDGGTTESLPTPPADTMTPLDVPADPLNNNGAATPDSGTPFGTPSVTTPSGSVGSPAVPAPSTNQ
jgi:hypothetical protein